MGPSGARRRILPTVMTETTIDARGLEPPEPLDRVIAALETLAPGDRLKLLSDVEPRPLYPMLERNGFAHFTEPGSISAYEIVIWTRSGG